MNFTPVDEAHMQRALALAERGLWTTKPNPRVGCVIAHGETIVGEGFHAHAGEPHAEVLALREAAERARGATAYVTLEPCSHYGRTPPCADALIAAGVARVIAAIEDPNPKVAGGGLTRLRENGIEVACGLLNERARALNVGFFSRMTHGRPWVRLKIASSIDGRTALANGESKWITGPEARADVQRWRARSSAILTGIGTVLADDPRLTARLESVCDADQVAEFVAPLRVVLDSGLRTPAHAHVLDGEAPTLIVHAHGAQPLDRRFDRIERVAADAIDGNLDLAAVLAMLAAREINELQVESGPILAGSLLRCGFVDELLLYVAPIILGDTARPMVTMPGLSALTDVASLTLIEQRTFGPDIRLRLLTGNDDVHRNH